MLLFIANFSWLTGITDDFATTYMKSHFNALRRQLHVTVKRKPNDNFLPCNILGNCFVSQNIGSPARGRKKDFHTRLFSNTLPSISWGISVQWRWDNLHDKTDTRNIFISPQRINNSFQFHCHHSCNIYPNTCCILVLAFPWAIMHYLMGMRPPCPWEALSVNTLEKFKVIFHVVVAFSTLRLKQTNKAT